MDGLDGDTGAAEAGSEADGLFDLRGHELGLTALVSGREEIRNQE